MTNLINKLIVGLVVDEISVSCAGRANEYPKSLETQLVTWWIRLYVTISLERANHGQPSKAGEIIST